VIAASASTLRDIVARQPGAMQKLTTAIVPNSAIRTDKAMLWSNSFISISLKAKKARSHAMALAKPAATSAH
jgi:hypothetical protein